MLEEAVEVIRLLWRGETVSHRGKHYVLENARIYTRPAEAAPIYVAGAGTKSATLAGKIGDGYIGTAPNAEAIGTFERSGGRGKPKYGQMTVCWAEDLKQAQKTAREIWPTAGLGGELTQELKLPAHFEQATKTVREEDVARIVVCGPDPEAHLSRIREYEKAGYDHVYLHQIGPDQEGFFRFYQRDVLPQLQRSTAHPQPART
jgi:G6PDH family F420-dependent oxidoreductase